jgi:general secretion pathway protein D
MGILVSVLDSKGYTIVNKGPFLAVVRASDATKQAPKVLPKGVKASGKLMVTQAIEVKSGNVDIVAAKIRYLISKTAKLITNKATNTIVVTDYPKNIERIKQVIREISNGRKFVVHVIHIQNTEAKKLQPKLNAIAKTLFNQKVSINVMKVLADEGLNSIILVGMDKNVARMEGIIKELDKESNVSNSVKIFSLKNSDAQAVLKSLTDIISKQQFKDPSLKPNVSASDEINAIIAVGDPLILRGIKKIIDELDKEKYQVYVQANIIEINKSDAESLGVKYGFDGAMIGSNGGLYALSANFGGANFGLDNVIEGIASNGLSAGFALNMAIDFLQTKGAAKSISNPSILCVNNKASSIYVGKTISIVSGSVANNAGGVGTGVTNSYKREDVGLTLKIKPRVSSNEKVTLEVETILESVLDDGANNATGQPVTSKQTVKTQAILRHGENIIIGGLVKTYERKNKTKVPLLGDIPFIGEWLFSSNETTVENDNLVVILTPYVIDKSSQLSKLQEQLGELARIQKKYEEQVFKKIEEEKRIDAARKLHQERSSDAIKIEKKSNY